MIQVALASLASSPISALSGLLFISVSNTCLWSVFIFMSPLIYQNNLNIKQYKKSRISPALFIYVNLIFELNYGNEQHLYYVNTFVSYDVDLPLLIIRGVSDDHEYELLSVHLDY